MQDIESLPQNMPLGSNDNQEGTGYPKSKLSLTAVARELPAIQPSKSTGRKESKGEWEGRLLDLAGGGNSSSRIHFTETSPKPDYPSMHSATLNNMLMTAGDKPAEKPNRSPGRRKTQERPK